MATTCAAYSGVASLKDPCFARSCVWEACPRGCAGTRPRGDSGVNAGGHSRAPFLGALDPVAAMARRRQFRGGAARAADLGRSGDAGCLQRCIILLVPEDVGGENGTAVNGGARAQPHYPPGAGRDVANLQNRWLPGGGVQGVY